jgi:hypothetical protein
MPSLKWDWGGPALGPDGPTLFVAADPTSFSGVEIRVGVDDCAGPPWLAISIAGDSLDDDAPGTVTLHGLSRRDLARIRDLLADALAQPVEELDSV